MHSSQPPGTGILFRHLPSWQAEYCAQPPAEIAGSRVPTGHRRIIIHEIASRRSPPRFDLCCFPFSTNLKRASQRSVPLMSAFNCDGSGGYRRHCSLAGSSSGKRAISNGISAQASFQWALLVTRWFRASVQSTFDDRHTRPSSLINTARIIFS